MEMFGLMGALISREAGMPQFLRLLKTRPAHNVSLLTFLMLLIGNLIMLSYFATNVDPVGLTFGTLGAGTCLLLTVAMITLRRSTGLNRKWIEELADLEDKYGCRAHRTDHTKRCHPAENGTPQSGTGSSLNK